MATLRPGYKREGSMSAEELKNAVASGSPKSDTKEFLDDAKVDSSATVVNGEVGEALDPSNLLANGKERPIETALDYATRLVSLDDDPTLPVHTFRMWVIGLGLTCFAAVLGQIFYFRPQTVYVSQLFLQVIAYALGVSWHKLLPKASRGRFWAFLNPGPFNIKEHVCIMIMSSTATDSALAISVFAADELYYNIVPNYGVAIFTLLGSQLFGYGIAGLSRSFTVFPTYIIFPNLIPTVNLFDVLHRSENSENAKRLRFFWIVFAAIFCWEWIPVICLAKRNSPWVTRIFGGSNGNEGLGLFSLCLDWNYIGSGGGSLGALFTPFATQVSQYAGVALCCIIFTTMYYKNTWEAQNYPFLSQLLFFENTLILNSDYSLNETALAQYGIPWYAPSNAIYYLGSNLAIGASLTHVFLWFGKPMIQAFKDYRTGEQPDPHYQKMLVYNEVPLWWYGATLLISFGMAMATCYTGNSQLPWWALIVALLVAMFVFPFVSVVYAVTGFNTDVQQLSQMLGAALVPGNSQANLYFTLYGSNTVIQARGLARDLKLGQYTKIPPRATFMAQCAGTIVGAILQLIIMKSIIASQRDILLAVQGTNIWSGQQVQSYNSQAVAWGALAKSMYGPGRPYFIIPLSIVIGLFVPVPFWIAHQFWPTRKFDQVVTPIMCWCLGYLSVGINSSVFGTMLIAIISQFVLRRYCASWFRKYNFLMSAGLDGGTQFMSFIATFALFGGSGKAAVMPTWALNPDQTLYNYDYCTNLT
ncbi:hypothetical protein RQP46_007222 [Phenoliferia psychrophenolica]